MRAARYYYIDPSGSDSNNGRSTSAAWASIAKVNATTLRAGDQVLFKRGGTWTGTRLEVSDSGRSGKPIRVSAYGTGADPIIDGGGTNTTRGTVDCVLLSGNWIVVEHIQTQHGNTYGIHVTGDDIECRRFVTRNQPIGIEQSATAARTSFHDFQAVDNNIVLDPGGANDDWAANGVVLAGDLAEVYNFTITGSRGVSADYGHDGAAVEVYGATNALISDGRASECDAFTELGHPSTNNIEYRNIEYTCSLDDVIAVNLQGTGVFGPVANIVITNVTIRQPSPNNTQGIVVNSGATLVIKNCVIESSYLGYMVEPQDEEHNVWYGGAGGNDVKSIHHATRSGIAPTSIIADPLYIDASAGNLRLRRGSPAINRGIAVPWCTDLDGNPRTVGAAPDAGAYERQTV